MKQLRELIRSYWGFEELRPLQAEAMAAVASGRDSLVVMPTVGGKSLCFQAPALQLPGLAVVVSPLISLMKDQVDALVDCGVPAACVNSTLSFEEKRHVTGEIRSGRLKLLYLSPELLMTERMQEFLAEVPLSLFAIDEAHCISEWGHDFRPEYRALRLLKQKFPKTAVHAYTATATPSVREDIVRELGLKNAEVLVGSFDRPNLVYRVQRRSDLLSQAREIIDRHPNDSGLIYCIRRADVEEISEALSTLGYQALPYHAGMEDADRRKNQDAFINDRTRIIVATVAFGMGIDKSNVRYVIHAAAPKSLEAYQQESGRAGRDGLEAECCLFYSAKDFQTWRVIQKDLPQHAYEIAMTVLEGIDKYCTGVMCRHRALTAYFGQELASDNCGACDVCLAEVDLVDDPLVLSQKILSCVVRIGENFGGEYTAQVLTGSREQRILDNQHDQLSTWGLLKDHDKKSVRGWIDQLIGQRFLKKDGEYSVLKVTAEGRRVLRAEITPQLLKPAVRASRKKSAAEAASWDGVDLELFEVLRAFRRKIAEARGIPPFIVFNDATLRDLARVRPSKTAKLHEIVGIGEKKAAEYGADLIREIDAYCRRAGATMDVATTAPAKTRPTATASLGGSASKKQAIALFAQGKSIDEVRAATGRAENTTVQYLVEFIEREKISDPSA